VEGDVAQWQPVVEWLEATWKAAERFQPKAKAAEALASACGSPRPVVKSAVGPSAPAAGAPAAERRPAREKVRVGPAERFGWLFNVFRSQT
jgi:hypothetical protein